MKINSRIVRLLSVVVAALGIAYTLMVGYIIYLGDELAFSVQPASYAEDTCAFLETANGDRIAYRYYQAAGQGRTLLYSHGSNVDMGHIDYISQLFLSQGYNVLMYDYPGVGLSSGKVSEAGTYAAATAMYTWLTQSMGTPEEQIVVYGRSVGCAPALHLAKHHSRVGDVVLVSPFLSPLRIITGLNIFPGDLFENYKTIQYVKRPLWIIHGTDDETVPAWHAEHLHELAPASTYLGGGGYGHGDIHEAPEHVALMQELAKK